MAKLIPSDNISRAWLQSMRYLEKHGGETTNLFVCIETPAYECLAVRERLDKFLLRAPYGLSVEKTASTIFPSEFYLPDRLGAGAQDHLYSTHIKVRKFEERFNRRGSYFDRMVRWPGQGRTVNQLQEKISHYRNEVARNVGTANCFEIGVSDPDEDAEYVEGEDIRIYKPGVDNSIMSFPCLSHVSISLCKHKLHMTAVYRNQYFIQKAYGNYLGLLRLLNFLATEIGVEMGELVCVATHANDEVHSKGCGKRVTQELLEECESLVEEAPSTPINMRRVPEPPGEVVAPLAAKHKLLRSG